MRNSIKMWQNDYSAIYEALKEAYNVSDEYFGNVCKPIAKKLKLYDIFGVDRANGVICGNTILCHYYTPLFSYGRNNGEYIKAMSVIGGKYIKLFDATKEYPIDTSIKYEVYDYGGFVKSPVGNAFSDKFVLFSVLCQIDFIIYCVDSWQFRNAMAHYKLGVALKKDELLFEDILFGLTQKYFKSDYLIVKKGIMQELESLACQMGDYLQLKDAVIKVNR